MGYSTSSIPTIRTIKAIRGESLTIDLGKVFAGTLQAWMKKKPNDPTYRSFSIVGNRYLQLTQDKASDYLDVGGDVTEAVEGKWVFDVEQILDPSKPEEVKTIYKGTIVFTNDVTGSSGVEVLNPVGGLNTFIGLTDTPNNYGTANQILEVNATGTALVWVDKSSSNELAVEAFLATSGQVSYTVGNNAIVDNGLYEVQVNGMIWNSRTGTIGFPLGNISIVFGTGVITFHFPLSLGDQIIIKYN